MKEVRKGAKKAKIFETQKIVKRLKGVRCAVCSFLFPYLELSLSPRKGGPGSEEVSTLEAQLEILKVRAPDALHLPISF